MSKISYIHRRRKVNGVIHNAGGSTIAFREISNGQIEYAEAKCSPRDNFSRAVGRVKATGRLSSDRYRKVAHCSWDHFIQNNSYNIFDL